DATLDTARQQAREALNDHFNWSHAWKNVADTLRNRPQRVEEREQTARSRLLGLRQLLIIRDASPVLARSRLNDIALISRRIAEQEMAQGILLDIPLLARRLEAERVRAPGLHLSTLLPGCLQRAFDEVRCSEPCVHDRALALMLRSNGGHADMLAALLELLQPALTRGAQHVEAAQRLHRHLDALRADAAHHARSEPAGALDRRYATLVARSLDAEAEALTFPAHASRQQAFEQARDRLQAFEQRRRTPREALAARHNAWAPAAHGANVAARPAQTGATGPDDGPGLLQRIDRRLNLFDLASATADPEPRRAPPLQVPGSAAIRPPLRKVIARAGKVTPAVPPATTASPSQGSPDTPLASSIRAYVPALWSCLQRVGGHSPAAISTRLASLWIRYTHSELNPLRVRAGIGAQWTEAEDNRYPLAELFRNAAHDHPSAAFLTPVAGEHIQIVAGEDGAAPPELNTPDVLQQLADLLNRVAARSRPWQPWMLAYLRAASPATAAALGRLQAIGESAGAARPAQRAHTLLRTVNQSLQKGWHGTSGNLRLFIQKYLGRFKGTPADVLDQQVTFSGWAKVRDGQMLHTGRMPYHFRYQKPVAWAIVRTPAERCDEATIVARARSSAHRHVQQAVAATVDLCQEQQPAGVAGNPSLRTLMKGTHPPVPAVLRAAWDRTFSQRAGDADYQAALALQIDLFLSTRLDNLRLQRTSCTLQGIAPADRAHYAAQAEAVRNGHARPLLLTVQHTSDTADGVILLPGKAPDEYLAVPIGLALPARRLVFGRSLFGGGRRLQNPDIAWLRQFYAPDRLQEGAVNAHVNRGFANGGISGGDGLGATWSTTLSPTGFVVTPADDPVGELARAHQARQQQQGQAVLRSQEEFAQKKRAAELEAVAEVLMEVAMTVGAGELLLPELLAMGEVEMAVVDGGLRIANYGAMGMQFASGWENMRADTDHPTTAKEDADNLVLSTLINLLLSSPDFMPSASTGERLEAATAEAGNAKQPLPSPIASGHLRGAYRIGDDLYIPLRQGTLHRARWEAEARGFRVIPRSQTETGMATDPRRIYRRKGDRFVPRKARTDVERRPGRTRNSDGAAAPVHGLKRYKLPAAISRTPIRDTDGEVKYLRYSARTKDGTPSGSQALVVSAHGSYLPSESEAAAGSVPVRIPADVGVGLMTPHDTLLMDAGIDACVNPPAGYSPYVSLRTTASGTVEITRVDFVPQQDHTLWNGGPAYAPESLANTLGRQDGLQNYRHHHYEYDDERDIARSLLRNRRRVANGRAVGTDILVVNGEAGIDSPFEGVIADTGVQKVLDLSELQHLTNERGKKYTSIIFAHCRNLATAPESTVSHYFISEAEVIEQLRADATGGARGDTAKGTAGATVDARSTLTLHILRRDDPEAPFVHHRLTLLRLAAEGAAATAHTPPDAQASAAPTPRYNVPRVVQFRPLPANGRANPWEHGPSYDVPDLHPSEP
ncbi:putative adhesin, partial [Stenotrophomonas sp. NPDC077659]|uniref:putative adhesin n=1 Tax=Stenotrophomonas sp. NPDC077659 TaxID=3390694 RepID=UPI003D023CA3